MFRALGVSGNSRFGAAAWRAVAGAAISPAIKAAFFIASAQSFTARIEPDPLLPVSNPPSPPAVSASRDAWSRACNVLMSRCWSSFNSSGPFIPDMNSCAWHSASLTSENGIMSFPGERIAATRGRQRRVEGTAQCADRACNSAPHRFHGHDWGIQCRRIEATRERRASLGQNVLDKSREFADQRQDDRHADDINAVVASQ